MKHILLVVVAVVLSGCTQSPHPIGGGLHMVTSSGAGFSSAGVTESVYEEAIKYAEERNKAIVVEKIDIQEGALGRNPPSAKLLFRLVDIDSAEAKSEQRLIPGLQKIQVIENSNNSKKEVSIEEKLSKLKKLRDDGLINTNEYEKARMSILSNF